MNWADDGRATFEYGDPVQEARPTSCGAASGGMPSSPNHDVIGVGSAPVAVRDPCGICARSKGQVPGLAAKRQSSSHLSGSWPMLPEVALPRRSTRRTSPSASWLRARPSLPWLGQLDRLSVALRGKQLGTRQISRPRLRVQHRFPRLEKRQRRRCLRAVGPTVKGLCVR
jgi:hypothetical protein